MTFGPPPVAKSTHTVRVIVLGMKQRGILIMALVLLMKNVSHANQVVKGLDAHSLPNQRLMRLDHLDNYQERYTSISGIATLRRWMTVPKILLRCPSAVAFWSQKSRDVLDKVEKASWIPCLFPIGSDQRHLTKSSNGRSRGRMLVVTNGS